MANKPLPTPDVLRQLLSYDPDAGKFTWRARTPDLFIERSGRSAASSCATWNKLYAGKQTFCSPTPNGYFSGQIFKHKLIAHRAAWAIYYGNWPEQEIDHINGIKTDNRISNLRVATRSQNNANRGANANRRFKGVYPNRRRWCAYIQHGGKTHYIGSFVTEEDAARAYDAAALKQHGEFAALNFTDFIAATQDAIAGQLTREEWK